MLFFYYLIVICIRASGVEDFVAVHDGNEVFGVTQIDDVVGVAGEHDDRLDVVTANLIVENLGIRVGFVSQLNKSVARDYREVLELAVVPVLALGDSGLGDVDAHLTTVERVHQLGERTTVVHIHFQVENSLFLGQIAQECAVEALSERVGRNFGNHQCGGHIGKLVEQLHNFAECCLMGYGAIAISSLLFEHRFIRLNIFFIIRFIRTIRVRSIHWNNL